MNKRVKKGLILILCCCLFGGCSKGEKQKETEVEEESAILRNGELAYSENGYYFYNDQSQIEFYDFSSKQVVYLCNKPECDHTDSSSCNSYAVGMVSGIQYVNGKIYYLAAMNGGLSLYSVDKDGSNREEVCVLASAYHNSGYSENFIVDNGYVFVDLTTDSGDDMEESVYMKKISESDEMQLLYSGKQAGESIQLPECYNNKAYFCTNYCAYDEDTEKLDTYGDVMSYDLESGELTTIVSDQVWGFTMQENELYYNNYNGEVKKIDLDTEKCSDLFTEEESSKFFCLSCDSEYIYVDNAPSTMNTIMDSSPERTIFIYDHSGKLVDTISKENGAKEGDVCLNISGNDKYLVKHSSSELLLFDKSQIGTGSYQWESVDITSSTENSEEVE